MVSWVGDLILSTARFKGLLFAIEPATAAGAPPASPAPAPPAVWRVGTQAGILRPRLAASRLTSVALSPAPADNPCAASSVLISATVILGGGVATAVWPRCLVGVVAACDDGLDC